MRQNFWVCVCAVVFSANVLADCLPKDFHPYEALALRDYANCSAKEIDTAFEMADDLLKDLEAKVAKWKKENKDGKPDMHLATLLSMAGSARALRTELAIREAEREAQKEAQKKDPQKP